MDTTTTSLNIININNINNNSLFSSSSSQSKSISELNLFKQQPPDFLNSINEFRDVSTALSAFLHHFDDLHNHITSISSAIDAQLPPHLLLLLHDTTATEAIFSVWNPNETENSDGDLKQLSNGDLWKVLEAGNDKLEGIDVLKKKESDSFVSEEDIDIWKMIDDIDGDDVSKKRKEAEIIEKINELLKEVEKIESFRKGGEIDKSNEEEGEDRDIGVFEKDGGEIELLVDGEIDTLEDEEIEISKEKDREIDVSKKKVEEIDISKEKDGEIDMFEEFDISKEKPREIIVSKKHQEMRISKRKHEEIDKAKRKDEEIDNLKKKDDKMVAFKRLAEDSVSKEPEISDILWKPEAEIDILTKAKERESLKEDGEDDTFNRTAENDAPKEPQEVTDASKKLVESDVLNKPKEIDVPKEPLEETDESKKAAEVDILNQPEEIDVPKAPQEETDASKNPVEIDVSNKPQEKMDASKKPVEIDVPNKQQEKTDGSKKPVEIDVSRKPQEETDRSKKPVEIASSNKSQEETDTSKKPVHIDVSNKPQEETDTSKKPVKGDVSNKPQENNASKKAVEVDVLNEPKEIDALKKPDDIEVANKPEEIDASKKPTIAVLEFLCKKMCAKEMKKHVVANFSELNSLHQEIAKALKLATNPAKLVLDSIGRYFLQTSRAYYYGESRHEQITARQASVLILECFVTISGDGIEITKEDKEYAENAAIDWRKRMVKEGGLAYMEAVDARGLLLFISGFGIPDDVFSNEDFRDLIKTSNVKDISNALRHSTILLPKLPEVIYWMVKNNFEIEAADIAYTFGLEDMCHSETMLMTFLKNKFKDTQNGSSLQVNAGTMQTLSDLKAIRRCLETHKIDPSKFLPGIKINEKIEQLEKVINALDLKSTEEKSTLKRKEKETEFSKDLNHHQQTNLKRMCFSHEILPYEQNPHLRPYNRSTQPSFSYLDRNLPNNYVTTYSASSLFTAPVLPPNTLNSVPSGLAGSYAPSVYGGPVVEPRAHTNNPWPYGWHQGQPYSRQSQAYDPYHPSTANFHGRPPWPAPAESFPVLPDRSLPGGFFGRRGPSSDLYRFADTVVERGSHRDSSSTH